MQRLVQSLVTRLDQDRAIAMLSTQVETDLAQEHAGLLLLARADLSRVSRGPGTACSTGAGRATPCFAGQPENTPASLRVRVAEYFCATTGSTPRGWLSHVALLAIETPGSSLPPPAVTERFAAQWAENVRAPRLALAESARRLAHIRESTCRKSTALGCRRTSGLHRAGQEPGTNAGLGTTHVTARRHFCGAG